jgi:uncharacterized damage-inducible protein DinB
MDLGTVRELVSYNTWANRRIVQAVSPLEPRQFTQNLGGSFPTLQATLTHILWAEWLWLERWQGGAPKEVFEPAAFPSVSSLEARWRQVQQEQDDFLQSLGPQSLSQPSRYTNMRGEEWEYPLWRQIYHQLNHSSYHRGQVTNMLRLLGATPATVDFLVYCDQRK